MSKQDRTDELGDIALAEELVFSPCGLVLERIPTDQGRSPDGWVLKYNQRRALCEIKSPRDDELIDELAAARGDDPAAPIVSASIIRTSNLAAPRLARHMKSAVTQFNALNRDRTVPNVLIIVNHADGWHAGDLQEALTGYFYAEGGEKFATEQKVARQIGDARRSTIDLYIWIDRKQRRVTAWIQGNASAEHDATIKALFLPEMRKARSPD